MSVLFQMLQEHSTDQLLFIIIIMLGTAMYGSWKTHDKMARVLEKNSEILSSLAVNIRLHTTMLTKIETLAEINRKAS